MSYIVKDFNDKKVVDYLRTGNYKSCLLVFHHGLGDALMFNIIYKTLKDEFPNIKIDQSLHLGQGEILPSVPLNPEAYDITFYISFPMNEDVADRYTKAEYCCLREIGMPINPNQRMMYNDCLPSPFVGTHYYSTCLPSYLGCPEDIAKKIHDSIAESGLYPLDTHMNHTFSNPANRAWDWNKLAVRDYAGGVRKLLAALQQCSGFCGVASGNFNLAMAVFDTNKLLYIKNKSPLSSITRLPIAVLDVNKYDQGIVNAWLDRIKEV